MTDSFGTESSQAANSKNIMGSIKNYAPRAMKGLAAASLAFYMFGTTYLKPNEHAVKQVMVSPIGILGHQGIQERVYGGGRLVPRIPFLETIHRFPADVQVIDMHIDPKTDLDRARMEHDAKNATIGKAAHIQTPDGFYVDLDVTIMYAVTNPYKTITKVGGGKLYETNGILPRAEAALKDSLGRLEPEEFYDPNKRFAQQEAARLTLNNVLAESGLSVYQVLIRGVHYHPEIQKRLEDRVLQEQLIETNKAIKIENDANATLSTIKATGENNVDVRRQTGTAYTTRKVAEQQEYERIKKANADKLVQLAEAERTRLVNDAYTGAGSDLLVAVEMAEVLKGIDTIFIPAGGPNGVNPVDLERMLKLIGGRQQ